MDFEQTVKLPDFFVKDRVSNLIGVDDLSYVEYRQYMEQGKNELLLTSYMFVVILCGTKRIHTDAKTVEIKKGSGFFARKGSYIVSERMSSETGEFNSLIFFFEDRFLMNFIRNHIPAPETSKTTSEKTGIFPLEITPFLKANIESVLPYFAMETEHSRDILKLKFEEILLNLLDADKTGEFREYLLALLNTRKKELNEVIEANLTKPLRIEELARLSGRSLTAFKKDFQKLYDKPPRAWINEKRLERAWLALKTSEKTVTEVCFETGFISLSHFIQLFKKRFGITPKQLRKSPNQTKTGPYTTDTI